MPVTGRARAASRSPRTAPAPPVHRPRPGYWLAPSGEGAPGAASSGTCSIGVQARHRSAGTSPSGNGRGHRRQLSGSWLPRRRRPSPPEGHRSRGDLRRHERHPGVGRGIALHDGDGTAARVLATCHELCRPPQEGCQQCRRPPELHGARLRPVGSELPTRQLPAGAVAPLQPGRGGRGPRSDRYASAPGCGTRAVRPGCHDQTGRALEAPSTSTASARPDSSVASAAGMGSLILVRRRTSASSSEMLENTSPAR